MTNPLVSDRYKAVFIDGLVLVGLMFVCSLVFANFESENGNLKMWAYILIVYSMSPFA